MNHRGDAAPPDVAQHEKAEMSEHDDPNSNGKVVQFKGRKDAEVAANVDGFWAYCMGLYTKVEELWDYFDGMWTDDGDRNSSEPEAIRKVLDDWDKKEHNYEVLRDMLIYLCREACTRGLKEVNVDGLFGDYVLACFEDTFDDDPDCNMEQWKSPDPEPPEVVARREAKTAAYRAAEAARRAAMDPRQLEKVEKNDEWARVTGRLSRITFPVERAHKCTRAEAIIHLRNTGETHLAEEATKLYLFVLENLLGITGETDDVERGLVISREEWREEWRKLQPTSTI